MRKGPRRRLSLVAATSVLLAAAGGVAWAAAPGSTTGESSGADPYLVRHTPGITVRSILTTGDSVDGYRMAGIPDGLGAYDNGDGTFTVLMNHELSSTSGVARAHGGKGSFISKWVVDNHTLRVISGSDLIQRVQLWDGTKYVQTVGAVFNRFCSADLAAPTAYFNPVSGKGYPGRIFTNGEETSGGRAFAHLVDTGETFQLPDFGAASWENVVANPNSGDRTVVIGTSDTGAGKVYVYIGDKQRSGNPVQQAGLAGGTTYAVSVTGLSTEDGGVDAPDGPLPFTLTADGGTGWDRPEDGAWDPNNPNDFYFVTTANMTKHSRL
ncbi:MAG TPA: hypothetical protein VF163_01590, partial [Micromonosporaceae bacterium]